MWKRQKRARAAPVERVKAPPLPPPPADRGPVRTVLPDGSIEEISAATGRSILLPSTPARQGVDVRPAAPAWGWAEIRRRLFGR
jgi:hypothetical protein